MTTTPNRRLTHNSAGAAYVEYLLVALLIALSAAGVYASGEFEQSLDQSVQDNAEQILGRGLGD